MDDERITMSVEEGTAPPLSVGNSLPPQPPTPPATPQRDLFRVLFKKCLKCVFLVPWEDEADTKCLNDPECPAQRFLFSSGRNPKALAIQLSEMMLQGDVVDQKKKTKMMKLIAKRKDGMQIQKMAFDLYSERVTDERRTKVIV